MDDVKAQFRDPSSLVELAKESCSIDKPNAAMTDEEVRTVCKWIGHQAPDTMWVEGKPTLGRMGIGAMLFITITEFPWFYEKSGLSQFN